MTFLALWFVESHFAQEIALDEVAAVAGVSRYHLSRTFSLATGLGLMADVRGGRPRHPDGGARLRMDDSMLTPLDPPRIVNAATTQIASLNERYDNHASAQIPAQWQRFTPHLDHVPGQIGHVACGVIHNSGDTGHADLEQGVARGRPRSHRWSGVRALRRALRWPHRQRRGRDLDSSAFVADDR